MKQIILNAYAKINLGLDVVKRRNDGYHELRTIMQTINLFDQLTLKKTSHPGITIHTNLDFLPTNENNLVYQAANLLLEEFQIPYGLDIQLMKKIPVAAGMAGGSSDAAVTLKGINTLFNLNLNLTDLQQRGVTLGADIPYCLLGGTALSEGIGELLSPLPPMPDCFIVVIKPSVRVSTQFVYKHLQLANNISHPDINKIISSIKQGNLYGVAAHLENILESVTIPLHPIISTLKKKLLSYHALGSLMSGSGPTVFGLFNTQETARKAYENLKQDYPLYQLFLTTLNITERQ